MLIIGPGAVWNARRSRRPTHSGSSRKGIDWALAFVSGLVGSFVGGLLISLLSGDGLSCGRPA